MLKRSFMGVALVATTLLITPALAAESDRAPPDGRGASGKVTGGKQSSHPDWFKESFLDIAEDVDEAAKAGKHVALILEMNGCPYCFKMIEENFAKAPYRDFIQEKFDVIALNVQGDREVALDAATSMTEKALAAHLGVRYTPTVVFLNAEKEPVARVNGYRNVEDFKRVLDYVATKAYQTQTLMEFLAATPSGGYSFRADPRIQSIEDLSRVADKPLAVLFEDAGCVACDALHDGHLTDPEVDAALRNFTLVRLDARAETAITAPDGTRTTARQFAETLGVTYRPTLVLFDQGKEIARIESQLYRYHFIGLLEYVGQRHYQTYPNSPFDYIDAKTAALTTAGKDVSVADE